MKKANSVYTPNSVPLPKLLSHLLFSMGLLAYGAFGIAIDDFYIPGKHSKGIHLHGLAGWTMYGAFLCAALNLLSVIVDHYDKRNNEARYLAFATYMKGIGWALFVIALIIEVSDPKE